MNIKRVDSQYEQYINFAMQYGEAESVYNLLQWAIEQKGKHGLNDNLCELHRQLTSVLGKA